MERIRVAVAGIGNCASSLVQGIEYYRGRGAPGRAGLMHDAIGGWRPSDVEFVAAFDVDRRKVGRPLEEAVFAAPNCARVFQPELPASGVRVRMGPVLDGIAGHMAGYADGEAFRPSDAEPADVAATLRDAGAQVLVCYLPVGSERAVRHYAQACLDAGVALVNCVPVFLASDRDWAERFRAAGLPIVGDDVKSQVGATIVHRALGRLFADRGVKLDRTYQLNTGGNTDFLNMLERERLVSKKISKTNSVRSQIDHEIHADEIHIGPSDHVPWLQDRKWAYIRLEGTSFGDVPLNVELKLEVEDSPNSAGVAIDAIRCAKVGMDRGVSGALEGPSAYFMKSPPVQRRDDDARKMVEEFASANPGGAAPPEDG